MGIYQSLDEFEVDLSGYEIIYEQCQFLIAYSDDLPHNKCSMWR